MRDSHTFESERNVCVAVAIQDFSKSVVWCWTLQTTLWVSSGTSHLILMKAVYFE